MSPVSDLLNVIGRGDRAFRFGFFATAFGILRGGFVDRTRPNVQSTGRVRGYGDGAAGYGTRGDAMLAAGLFARVYRRAGRVISLAPSGADLDRTAPRSVDGLRIDPRHRAVMAAKVAFRRKNHRLPQAKAAHGLKPRHC